MADRRRFIGQLARGFVWLTPAITFAQHAREGFRASAFSATPRVRPGTVFAAGSASWATWMAAMSPWNGGGRTARPIAIPALAIELVQSKVDLIVTSSTPATLAAKQATSSIPIVMLNSAYPTRSVWWKASPARAAMSRASATCRRNWHGQEAPAAQGNGAEGLARGSHVESSESDRADWVPGGDGGRLPGSASRSNRSRCVCRTSIRRPSRQSTASRADALAVFGNPVNFKNYQLIVDFALTQPPAEQFRRADLRRRPAACSRMAPPSSTPTGAPRPSSTRSSRVQIPPRCRSSSRPPSSS